MSFRLLRLICLLAMLPILASAAETHDVVLGAGELFQIAETGQWRFEVQKELSGRFADVRIVPKQGHSFSLTLYFIADPPDLARLDSPEKMARSVREGAERYLAQSVEKEITLLPIFARASYGYRAVLTDADPPGASDGYHYITRGMVRVSPDAALGFSLLSQDIDTASYNRLLNYVYGFIRHDPASASGLTPKPVPAAQVSLPQRPRSMKTGAGRDLRDCLSLSGVAEIARCSHAK